MLIKLWESKWGYVRTYCNEKLFKVYKRNSSVKKEQNHIKVFFIINKRTIDSIKEKKEYEKLYICANRNYNDFVREYNKYLFVWIIKDALLMTWTILKTKSGNKLYCKPIA